MRSAHRADHQAVSSAPAKHQAAAEQRTSVKPAARAHDSRRRPASGSPPLARATRRYRLCHSSSPGTAGYQVIAA